ncbi:MAG: hypothetical protein HOP07_00895 [Bacteriovoracaceae bacterium]|nr:hypothetical protein [Bacteriovoracaceae bacterium]
MELEIKKDKSKLFSSIEKLKPRFTSNKEAIQYFTKKLKKISIVKKCTIEDLILSAEEKPTDDSLLDALSLSRKIQFLKKLR